MFVEIPCKVLTGFRGEKVLIPFATSTYFHLFFYTFSTNFPLLQK